MFYAVERKYDTIAPRRTKREWVVTDETNDETDGPPGPIGICLYIECQNEEQAKRIANFLNAEEEIGLGINPNNL